MNPEVVNILVTIDKSADKVLKKYTSDSHLLSQFRDQSQNFPKTPKPFQFHSRVPSFIQQDRRERRTLRAKINCILNNLPAPCKSMSRKDLKLQISLKKKKIDQVNQIRKKLGKESLNAEDLSFDSSFDKYGNIKSKAKSLAPPLTPRSALKSKLTQNEYEMLKEDPVYFIQNEKYKFKIKLDEDENWEKLLDGESYKKIRVLNKKSFDFDANELAKKNKAGDKASAAFVRNLIEVDDLEKRVDKKNKETDREKKFENIEKNGILKIETNDNARERKIKKVTVVGEYFKTGEFVEKNKGIVEKYNARLEKIKKMKLREMEVDERIFRFEKEAKKAEELYSSRLRQKALQEKVAKTKIKALNFDRNTFEKVDTPNDKMRIKYSFREF